MQFMASCSMQFMASDENALSCSAGFQWAIGPELASASCRENARRLAGPHSKSPSLPPTTQRAPSSRSRWAPGASPRAGDVVSSCCSGSKQFRDNSSATCQVLVCFSVSSVCTCSINAGSCAAPLAAQPPLPPPPPPPPQSLLLLLLLLLQAPACAAAAATIAAAVAAGAQSMTPAPSAPVVAAAAAVVSLAAAAPVVTARAPPASRRCSAWRRRR